MSETPKLTLDELAVSQNPDATVNAALRKLDALVQGTVIDKDLSDAPSGPSDGDTYIIAAGTTSGDDWDDAVNGGVEGAIAYYQSSAWIFLTPAPGWLFYVQDEAAFYYYAGTSDLWQPM